MNWFAVVVAGVSAFILGGVWYGPLFSKRWQLLVELSDEEIASGNPVIRFGLSFVMTLIVSIALAAVMPSLLSAPALLNGMLLGAGLSLFFVATSFAINYLFARRPLALYAIDVGYLVLMFALMGAILGGWR